MKTAKRVAVLAGAIAFGTCQGQEGVWDKYLIMVAGMWAAEGLFGEEAQRRFNSTIVRWHEGGPGRLGGAAVPAIAERPLDEQLIGEDVSLAFRQGRPVGPHYGGGALHQSTAPGPAPVVARGFKMEPAHESWVRSKVEDLPDDGRRYHLSAASHYYDENYVVDYEGDGYPEHRLSVDDNYFDAYNFRAFCSATTVGTAGGWVGDQGICTGFVGSPDSFTLNVWRRWVAAGMFGEAQPRFETVNGLWRDRETGHVGVYWAGPSIAEPRPLETPIRGEAEVLVGAEGILPDGGVVHASANGTLGFDLSESTVALKIGDTSPFFDWRGFMVFDTEAGEFVPFAPPELADLYNPDRYPVGVALYRRGEEWEFADIESYPPVVIEQVFEFEERYDPSSPYFGVGEQQLNRENDVVSGNARGQFGGVITTEPGSRLITTGAGEAVIRDFPSLPKVHGTAGLAEIAGYEGLSLILYFQAIFPPDE